MAKPLLYTIEVDDNGSPKLKQFRGQLKNTGGQADKTDTKVKNLAKGLRVVGAAAVAAGTALAVLSGRAILNTGLAFEESMKTVEAWVGAAGAEI